jgi:hypothetical protein
VLIIKKAEDLKIIVRSKLNVGFYCRKMYGRNIIVGGGGVGTVPGQVRIHAGH